MILVDTHVHIHPGFRIGEFFDAAAANFGSAATRAGYRAASHVLCLTESAGRNCFEELSTQDPPEGGWRFKACGDGLSLFASAEGGREMWVVAGRQVVSRDGLEVLALCTNRAFAEKELSLADLVEKVLGTGALAVVPWGAGKWWGRRGRILTDLVNKGPRAGFFLADNSGRPAFWTAVAQFDIARANGIGILAGTDPLPFAAESRRAGKNGIVLNCVLDADRPAGSLKTGLADPAETLTPYGEREHAFRFARNQIAMQVVKRFNRRASGSTQS